MSMLPFRLPAPPSPAAHRLADDLPCTSRSREEAHGVHSAGLLIPPARSRIGEPPRSRHQAREARAGERLQLATALGYAQVTGATIEQRARLALEPDTSHCDVPEHSALPEETIR